MATGAAMTKQEFITLDLDEYRKNPKLPLTDNRFDYLKDTLDKVNDIVKECVKSRTRAAAAGQRPTIDDKYTFTIVQVLAKTHVALFEAFFRQRRGATSAPATD